MDSIDKLAALFAQFPGIGTRQAHRFVYHLLKREEGYVRELIRGMESLRHSVTACTSCARFFVKKHDGAMLCSICANPGRDNTVLMVVEKDADLEAVEKSGTYQGKYFVLGGALPILEKNPEDRIRIRQLTALVTERLSKGLREIIIATAFTPESEHTADYVRTTIAALFADNEIKITTLGRGLSTGTELEYSDAETLRYALEGRK
jgi:recombination protein RecR